MNVHSPLALSHEADPIPTDFDAGPAPRSGDAIADYGRRQRERTRSILSERAAHVRVRELLTGMVELCFRHGRVWYIRVRYNAFCDIANTSRDGQ